MNGLDHQVHKKRRKKEFLRWGRDIFCFLFAVSVFRPNLAAGHIHGVCRKERTSVYSANLPTTAPTIILHTSADARKRIHKRKHKRNA